MSDIGELLGRPPGWLEPSWLGEALFVLVERGWTTEQLGADFGVPRRTLDYITWWHSPARLAEAQRVAAELAKPHLAGEGELRTHYSMVLGEVSNRAREAGFKVLKTRMAHQNGPVKVTVKFRDRSSISAKSHSLSLPFLTQISWDTERFECTLGRFSSLPIIMGFVILADLFHWYDQTPPASGIDLIGDCLVNLHSLADYLAASPELREQFLHDQRTITYMSLKEEAQKLPVKL